MKLKQAMFTLVVLVILGAIGVAATPDQPYMQAARSNLVQARAALQRAARNKAGHRANALGLVNSAIGEVDLGIRYDRQNHHAEKMPATAATMDQPNMQAALDYLKEARSNLDKASADKGGHRAKAIDYVKKAIDEVKKGIDAGD